jgi:4-hydroxy-tetrahydrodipicolinate synthase
VTPRSLGELREALRTVVAINVTPFADDGSVDEAAYRALLVRAADAGIAAFTANGNTSEFYSLTPTERHRALELTVDSVGGLVGDAAGGAVVLAGVGLDAGTAIDEGARHAELGAECVMVHQPVHPFWSLDGWVAYHRAISEALPDVGVVPYIRDNRIGVQAIRALLTSCPNVIGVKYASPDPAAFAALVAGTDDLEVAWICGVAETWAPFFAVAGATGFTSGLAVVDPARSLRLLRHLQAGQYDAAMVEWQAVAGFEALRARGSSEFNVSVVKEALAQLGLCRRDVRAPLSLLPDADRETVTRILDGWGLVSPA